MENEEKEKSKLAIITEALEANQHSTIIYVDEDDHSVEKNPVWIYTVDFWVAPKKGQYESEELQEFMMKLVPLKPDYVKKFRYEHVTDKSLCFGALLFNEELSGEDLKFLGVSDYEKGTRGIFIRPLPSERYARDVLLYRLDGARYKARLQTLEAYKYNKKDSIKYFHKNGW